MSKLLGTLCGLGVLLLAAPALGAVETEAFDKTDWAWCNDVPIGSAPLGYVRLPIPPKIFERSRTDLNDLRLLDPDGDLEPFIIHWGRAETADSIKWRSLFLFNKTYEPNEYVRAVVDFKDKKKRNRLRVFTTGSNFRRRVMLEGSDQTEDWQLISEDLWLFDLGRSGARARMNVLEFPANDFRYLRITVFNMEDDLKRISIGRVQEAYKETEEDVVPVKAALTAVTQDKKAKKTLYEIDLGHRNLPVTSIEFQVEDARFHRVYELFGRNAAEEIAERETETGLEPVEREVPWQKITTGVIYRVERDGHSVALTKVERLNAPYRYLQLRVYNGDDAPLNIERVSAKRREVSVIFEALCNDRPYWLLGGNHKAEAPAFDLARTIGDLGSRELPVVTLGRMRKVEQVGKPLPWTERNRVLIWVVLIGVVAFVAAMIVINFRKLKGEEPPAE